MTTAAPTIRDHTGRLRAVAELLRLLVETVPRVDGWSGAAAGTYRAVSGTLCGQADAVAAVLEELADRLDGHAARLAVAGPELAGDLVHARLRLEVATDLAVTDGADHVAHARAAQQALDRIGDVADPVTGRPVEAHLLAYDPDAFGGDGRVVVAAGDPATADDVAVLVPGLGTDGRDAAVLAGRAADLHVATRGADPADGNAVVAWIGYDAPEGVGVLSERMAREGGGLLTDAVDELRGDRVHDPAHLTVVGHSYGATTVSLAATGPGRLAADDVVLAGSPGAGDAVSAADLGLRPRHVWVLRNSLDPVAALGTAGPLGLGEDPALAEWGATRLRAESATPGQDWPLADHASYFTAGGEGIGNLAHVVAGQHDRVTTAPPLRDPWWSPPLDPELGRTPARPAPGPVR